MAAGLVAELVEEGETPAEVAVRETTEESACVIRQLLPVAGYFPAPAAPTSISPVLRAWTWAMPAGCTARPASTRTSACT
ncbi:MAG: hypothetical protein IPF57_03555 [Gammaproteobacteria bacterium]|nr:hypothetical protein [Gammaproteobacteria bacterium]